MIYYVEELVLKICSTSNDITPLARLFPRGYMSIDVYMGIILFTWFYFGVYLMTPTICRWIVGAAQWRKFNNADRMEWRSRIVSTVNAVLTTQGMVRSFIHSYPAFSRNPIGYYCPLAGLYTSAICGYFVFDLVHMWMYPHLLTKGHIVHHVTGLLSFPVTFMYRSIMFTVVLYVATEATTPMVNLRWFLASLDMKNSIAYLINGSVGWLAFFFTRILVNNFYIAYVLISNWRAVLNVSWAVHLTLWTAWPTAMALNSYWFIFMSKGVLKLIRNHVGGNLESDSEKKANGKLN